MKLKQMKLGTMFMAVAAALASRGRRFGLGVGAVELEIDKAAWAKLPKDVQALYVEKDGKYKLDGVEQEDVSGLKSALGKERDERKAAERKLKETLDRFEGIDPEEVKRILAKLGDDEETTLIKAGKLDEVVSRRMTKAQQAHVKEIEKMQGAVAAAEGRTAKFSQRVLDNHIRAAATKSGLHANAVEDALFRARTIFVLDDEGNAIQLDSDKKPVMGKDGKSPFSPGEWLDGMKESAPHWFPNGNSGGGSQGGGKGNGATKTMKRSEFDALDPAARHKAMSVDKVTVVD